MAVVNNRSQTILLHKMSVKSGQPLIKPIKQIRLRTFTRIYQRQSSKLLEEIKRQKLALESMIQQRVSFRQQMLKEKENIAQDKVLTQKNHSQNCLHPHNQIPHQPRKSFLSLTRRHSTLPTFMPNQQNFPQQHIPIKINSRKLANFKKIKLNRNLTIKGILLQDGLKDQFVRIQREEVGGRDGWISQDLIE